LEELVRYMKALLLIQLGAQLGGGMSTKPELLLARAGLKAKEIAELLGKSEAAVAKAISRARDAAKTQEIQENE
jgi:hypothetical protein